MADDDRQQQWSMEIAERLGDHGARIGQLERRMDGDVREIRASIMRLETQLSAAAKPSADTSALNTAALALHRAADAIKEKPAVVPAPETIASLIKDAAQHRSPSVLMLLSIGLNALMLMWLGRQLFGVSLGVP